MILRIYCSHRRPLGGLQYLSTHPSETNVAKRESYTVDPAKPTKG